MFENVTLKYRLRRRNPKFEILEKPTLLDGKKTQHVYNCRFTFRENLPLIIFHHRFRIVRLVAGRFRGFRIVHSVPIGYPVRAIFQRRFLRNDIASVAVPQRVTSFLTVREIRRRSHTIHTGRLHRVNFTVVLMSYTLEQYPIREYRSTIGNLRRHADRNRSLRRLTPPFSTRSRTDHRRREKLAIFRLARANRPP